MESFTKPNIIICPIIASWLVFGIQFITCLLVIAIYPIYNSEIRLVLGRETIYFKYIDFYLILIMILLNIFLLVISILITISIERKKYHLYFVSIILTIIYEVIITVFLLLMLLFTIKYGYEAFLFVLSVLTEWSLLLVLLLYRKRFKNDQLITINENQESII